MAAGGGRGDRPGPLGGPGLAVVGVRTQLGPHGAARGRAMVGSLPAGHAPGTHLSLQRRAVAAGRIRLAERRRAAVSHPPPLARGDPGRRTHLDAVALHGHHPAADGTGRHAAAPRRGPRSLAELVGGAGRGGQLRLVRPGVAAAGDSLRGRRQPGRSQFQRCAAGRPLLADDDACCPAMPAFAIRPNCWPSRPSASACWLPGDGIGCSRIPRSDSVAGWRGWAASASVWRSSPWRSGRTGPAGWRA